MFWIKENVESDRRSMVKFTYGFLMGCCLRHVLQRRRAAASGV